MWDVATGTERTGLEVGGSTIIQHIAFSPNGLILAVGGEKGNLTLWDWRRRRRLRALEGHRAGISTLAFSPDGSKLIVGDSSGCVKIWNVASGREQAGFLAYAPTARGVVAVAASPKNDLLATVCFLEGVVRLWDAVSGQPRGTIPAPVLGAFAMSFSPNGKTMAIAGGDGIATLWEVASRRRLGEVRAPGGTLQSVAFSVDGRVLATGGRDGIVRFWDVELVIGGIPRAAS
jgi:WD40 repeat protein